MFTQSGVDEIMAIINPMSGLEAWGALQGVGTGISFMFGAPRVIKWKSRHTFGEWHLWLRDCAWRLEIDGEIVIGAGDERDRIAEHIQVVNSRKLLSVKLTPPLPDATFSFEGGLVLRTFAYCNDDFEHWLLFTPGEMVLSLGPGTRWSYGSEDT